MSGPRADAELVERFKVVSGRHYRFERVSTLRQVDDDADQGEISLLSYVYRPLVDDRGQLAFYLHGSTGGMMKDPAEPWAPQTSVINYFVGRGFTLVVPLRRGFSGSGGTFIAECDVWNDPECTRDRYIDLAEPGLADAVTDTTCVLDHFASDAGNARDAKVLLVGQSRGGFLALAVAATRPDSVRGVVSFAGGWLRVGASLTSAVNARSRTFMANHLRRVGRSYSTETLWIYGSGDSFYSEEMSRGLFDDYRESGGSGRYVHIAEHPQPDGHQIICLSSLWAAVTDGYLIERGFRVDPIES